MFKVQGSRFRVPGSMFSDWVRRITHPLRRRDSAASRASIHQSTNPLIPLSPPPFLLRGGFHPLWGDKIVAWGTRLLAHRPASFGGRIVEQATGQLASRLPGSGGRVTAARHQQVEVEMVRKSPPDP